MTASRVRERSWICGRLKTLPRTHTAWCGMETSWGTCGTACGVWRVREVIVDLVWRRCSVCPDGPAVRKQSVAETPRWIHLPVMTFPSRLRMLMLNEAILLCVWTLKGMHRLKQDRSIDTSVSFFVMGALVNRNINNILVHILAYCSLLTKKALLFLSCFLWKHVLYL